MDEGDEHRISSEAEELTPLAKQQSASVIALTPTLCPDALFDELTVTAGTAWNAPPSALHELSVAHSRSECEVAYLLLALHDIRKAFVATADSRTMLLFRDSLLKKGFVYLRNACPLLLAVELPLFEATVAASGVSFVRATHSPHRLLFRGSSAVLCFGVLANWLLKENISTHILSTTPFASSVRKAVLTLHREKVADKTALEESVEELSANDSDNDFETEASWLGIDSLAKSPQGQVRAARQGSKEKISSADSLRQELVKTTWKGLWFGRDIELFLEEHEAVKGWAAKPVPQTASFDEDTFKAAVRVESSQSEDESGSPFY